MGILAADQSREVGGEVTAEGESGTICSRRGTADDTERQYVPPNNSLCDPFARKHAPRFVRLKRRG